MRHDTETNTTGGLSVLICILAFGMVWMYMHSDEIAKREKQRLDNIIKTYKLH